MALGELGLEGYARLIDHQAAMGALLARGRTPAGLRVAGEPLAPSDEVSARGLRQYTIYCQPCHEKRGTGRGILFEYGKVPMPSFHEERIVTMPDGEMEPCAPGVASTSIHSGTTSRSALAASFVSSGSGGCDPTRVAVLVTRSPMERPSTTEVTVRNVVAPGVNNGTVHNAFE